MGDMLWDLIGEDTNRHGLPPGFRFHPTDEELITYYLASKVYNIAAGHGTSSGSALLQIVEIDLNRCEPWELPDVAKMGEREWYFFSLKDRKYPTGLRTNRATGAGYWKATGKDREVYSSSTHSGSSSLVGMKKTLVFYKGRAPRGEKTKWVLHEYRLDGHLANHLFHNKEEWVICRIFHKAVSDQKKIDPFLLNHAYILEPPSSSSSSSSCCFSSSTPFLMHETPNIQAFLQKNTFININSNNIGSNDNSVMTIGNNNHVALPINVGPPPLSADPSSISPANITSLLKSNPNHCLGLVRETIPVPEQCNVQTLEEDDQFDRSSVLNWTDYPNPHNPWSFDVGIFNSSLYCAGNATTTTTTTTTTVHDMHSLFSRLPPLPTGATLGDSLPLIP